MQAWVTRTRASVGSRRVASGTSSTRMSRGPWYTLALKTGSHSECAGCGSKQFRHDRARGADGDEEG